LFANKRALNSRYVYHGLEEATQSSYTKYG
jgi:hypothetical protein